MKGRSGLWVLLLLAALMRLPFLNQAIQGDDIYYLYAAQHALIDPAHPNHAEYLVQGDKVSMRGHPHPPLNGWILGGLLALFGDIYEISFHSAYIVFTLIAAASVWSIATRFTPRPFYAASLFLVTPAFVVNGASLESDLPFVALWLASTALFLSDRLVLSTAALAATAMAAFQSVVISPILWLHRSRILAFTPVVVF